MLEQCLQTLRDSLSRCFNSTGPEIHTNWPISGRTVSEIGGRLIEDFVLLHLPQELLKSKFDGEIRCCAPDSGRAIEDIAVHFTSTAGDICLLVDVKGHNELQTGSRPNLASIRKCIELYSDANKANTEIVVFYCRYQPSLAKGGRSEAVSFNVLPTSFSKTGVFLLRELSDSNMDPANIGSGGQVLLAREDKIILSNRSRANFVSLMNTFQSRLAAAKSNGKAEGT